MWILYPTLFLIPVLQWFLPHLPNGLFRYWHYFICVLVVLQFLKLDIYSKKAVVRTETRWMITLSSLIGFLADSISHYFALAYTGTDFGIFSSILQNTGTSRFGYSEVADIYHLGVHQHWFFLALAPFLKFLNPAYFLLVIGVLLLWIPGVILMRWVGRQSGELTGLLAGVAWWSGSFTLQALHGWFYPEFFYPLLILWFAISYFDQRPIQMLSAAFLFLLVKEDAAFYLIGFSIYLALKQENKSFFIYITMATLVLFLNLKIARPYFLERTGVAEPIYLVFWAKWGQSQAEMIRNILMHPLNAILSVASSVGWKKLYGPMLMLPLTCGAVFWISFPGILLLGLASQMPGEYGSYYPLVLWPLALVGLQRVLVGRPKFLALLLLVCPLFGSSWLEFKEFNWSQFQNLTSAAKTLDPQLTYCVQDGIWPYLEPLHSLHSHRLLTLSSQHLKKCERVLFSPMSNPYPKDSRYWQDLVDQAKVQGCIVKSETSFFVLKANENCSVLFESFTIN